MAAGGDAFRALLGDGEPNRTRIGRVRGALDQAPRSSARMSFDTYKDWIVKHVAPLIRTDCGGAQQIIVNGPSLGAYHGANFA